MCIYIYIYLDLVGDTWHVTRDKLVGLSAWLMTEPHNSVMSHVGLSACRLDSWLSCAACRLVVTLCHTTQSWVMSWESQADKPTRVSHDMSHRTSLSHVRHVLCRTTCRTCDRLVCRTTCRYIHTRIYKYVESITCATCRHVVRHTTCRTCDRLVYIHTCIYKYVHMYIYIYMDMW